MKRTATLALLAAPALLLVACSGGSDEAATASAAPSPTAAASTSAAASPSPSSDEASPSGATETILAVLCDEASDKSVAAIESELLPDYTLSKVIDVRTDDDGKHAILGFVEGPGLAVLAQWTGTGLGLEGLAAADVLAAQVTGLPQATPDQETTDLMSQTLTCHSTIFPPGSDDDKKKDGDKKKDDKNSE